MPVTQQDFNDLDQLFGSPDPMPSRGGLNPRGSSRGRGRGVGTQLTPNQIASTTRGQPYFSRGFNSRGGRGQPPGRGFAGQRGGGRGSDRGSRGRGIGAFRPLNDDVDPDDLALRNLTISTHGTNPLLHPVVFVKSRTVLFQDLEEIFMPEVADSGKLRLMISPVLTNYWI